MSTTAIFYPFDLFGSAGTAAGAELLADACREMLQDNRREKTPTRAKAYTSAIRLREVEFRSLDDFSGWRREARKAVRNALKYSQFLIWATGNHLGVLPVYEVLGKTPSNTLIVQLDAHLDIYNLSDCTAEPSHGNFLLHAESPLPQIINIGSRELLLEPGYVGKYYSGVHSAARWIEDSSAVLRQIRTACRLAKHVWLDIDCDVFDPTFFPAVLHPQPFGLSPQDVLRILAACWSAKTIGVALSEFCPARDQNDRSLATLLWLIEHILLLKYEGSGPRGG